jgi:hypothetical protein
MSQKIDKIAEMVIDIEGMDDDLFEEFGVDVISLVDEPAIEVGFMAFAYEELEVTECDSSYELSEEAEDALIEYCTENGEEITMEDLVIDFNKNEFAGVKDVIQAIQSLDILKRLSIKRDEPAEEYWRYTGPPAQRKFCKAMLNLSKAGKIFSKKDIVKMDGLNKQFAKKGQSSYSIFKYKGGKNCNHYWEKLRVFKNDDGKKVVIVAQPTKKTERVAGETWDNMQFSLDSDKRIVSGPVMIPNKMILRRGKDGEPYYVYASRNTIRKVAEKFLKLSNHNNTDVQHDHNVVQTNTLLETWISESKTHDKSYAMGFNLPIGTWYVSYKINDDETWNRIKTGELKGFSLAGDFITKITNAQQDQQTIESIKRILNNVTKD